MQSSLERSRPRSCHTPPSFSVQPQKVALSHQVARKMMAALGGILMALVLILPARPTLTGEICRFRRYAITMSTRTRDIDQGVDGYLAQCLTACAVVGQCVAASYTRGVLLFEESDQCSRPQVRIHPSSPCPCVIFVRLTDTIAPLPWQPVCLLLPRLHQLLTLTSPAIQQSFLVLRPMAVHGQPLTATT